MNEYNSSTERDSQFKHIEKHIESDIALGMYRLRSVVGKSKQLCNNQTEFLQQFDRAI